MLGSLLMFVNIILVDICSSKFIEPAKTAVYEFQSDTVLRAQRSPSKQQHQPSKIEDYEPGRCSLAVGNHVEVRLSPAHMSLCYVSSSSSSHSILSDEGRRSWSEPNSSIVVCPLLFECSVPPTCHTIPDVICPSWCY